MSFGFGAAFGLSLGVVKVTKAPSLMAFGLHPHGDLPYFGFKFRVLPNGNVASAPDGRQQVLNEMLRYWQRSYIQQGMSMVAITRLEPSDHITVDHAVVSGLFRRHGATMAEDILIGHVVELTDGISAIDGNGQTLRILAERDRIDTLADRAASIGLASFAQSLKAVVQAANAGNRAALPALWDRVKRVGDRSLVMLWDLPQLRM